MNHSDAAVQDACLRALTRRTLGRHLRHFVVSGLLLSLAACGFELRKTPEFAFKSIYIEVTPASTLGVEIKRNLAAMGNVELVTDAAQAKNAQVILEIPPEQRVKTVVGVNASGQVVEFQLQIKVRFRLRTPQGKELIPDTELVRSIALSFSESAALSKEAEEVQLYRNLQTDIVQQLMRRLAAVKEL